jgi:Rieske Fe-S protein
MDRRRALVVFINSVVALIGGSLTAILGAFALRPVPNSDARWMKAGQLLDLTPNTPVPRVVSLSRHDGWYRERARATVFLVWDGKRNVHALSATCTHLGCQVRWDQKATQFRCPCHGGVFDASGRVLSGPPPRGLERIEARLDESGETVLVRL